MSVRSSITAAFAVLFLACSAAHAEHYAIPLFPAPDTSGDPQGVLRIVNNTGDAATVQIFAIADDGTRSGPATIALGATAAAEFDATELRSANAGKGLSGGLGSISGDVRLMIDSDAPIVPLAFVRASDGTLSAMHDTVRAGSAAEGEYRYDVPIFNLSTAVAQASRLRLINTGDTSAAVAIEGRDDGAAATGGAVRLTLPAGGARTLTAQQLEAGGTGLTGRLGAGIGRWRLTVSSDQALRVVNVVESSTGHWNNLSTTAVRGAAPTDPAGFNDRFVGQSAVLEAEAAHSSLMFMENGRFSETREADGLSATLEGAYDYVSLGPDAGRLTLDYDDGTQCEANLYFSSRTGGWFASHCTGGPDPETRSGGNWFVADEEDDGGGTDPVETSYGVGATLPGVPTSGLFDPAGITGGSSRFSGGSTTVDLNDGGYFELSDGTRYTCASAGGCEIVDGTVTRGSVTGRTSGSDGVATDRFPILPRDGRPGNRTYTVGTEIDALTLPEATGGNPPLTYSLSPDVPGLSFDTMTRRLNGTPTTAGTHTMTYTVTDEDGDTASFGFSITVEPNTTTAVSRAEFEASAPSGYMAATLGDSGSVWGVPERYTSDSSAGTVGYMLLGTLKGCDFANAEVDRSSRVYIRTERLGTLSNYESTSVCRKTSRVWTPSFAGVRMTHLRFFDESSRTNVREYVYDNATGGYGETTPSHVPDQAGGVFDLDADNGDSDVGMAGQFQLYDDNDAPRGIAFANGRLYVVDRWDEKVYAYTASGDRDPMADFDLASSSDGGSGIDFANGTFYVAYRADTKVYAYTASGDRDPAADFDLHGDNANPRGIAHSNGQFYVTDGVDRKVYAYAASGARNTAAEFDLHADNGQPGGIAYAMGRFHVVDWRDDKVYAYTDSGARDSGADFNLREDLGGNEGYGITYGNDGFYVVDSDSVVSGPGNTDTVRFYPAPMGGTGDADDHGDTFDTATTVSIPSATQGELEEGKEDGDRDYFRVVVAATTLTVETTGNVDTFGTLFDGSRTQLATNDDGGSGRNFRIERQLQAGTYYVEVRGYRPSSTGSYELSVSVVDNPGGGGDDGQTTFGVGDTLTDLPTGVFGANVSGGSIRFSGGNSIIDLNNGGHFEYGNYRYTCQTSGGCMIENRRVTAGTVVQSASSTVPGGGETGTDAQPSFAAGSNPGDQSYTVGTAIDALTLPVAGGGDGSLSYSLTPEVPGLIFNATATVRRLTGTPTTAGTYDMTYTARDVDGDTDTLTFTIVVASQMESQHFRLDRLNGAPVGITHANDRFYVVDRSDGNVYAYASDWQRDSVADFDLHDYNSDPAGIAYSNGLFFVVDGRDDKVYAYTETGARDASADFDLHDDNSLPLGIAYSNGLFFVVDVSDDKVYAYTETGARDASADFDLHYPANLQPSGIAYANDRLHVVDRDRKVYAYWSHTGQRDTSAEFDLHDDHGRAGRIAYDNGRFYVVDYDNDRVFYYPEIAEPDGPDLMANSASVSASELSAGTSYTLSAVVRNRGNQPSAATTLRYFRSSDPIISATDTEIGTDMVGGLSAGATSDESINLTAPSVNDCYYCGACIDSVDGESTTSNNCSNPVLVAVGEQADLSVSFASLDAPSSGTVGVSPIYMTVEVTNRGQVASPPSKLSFSGGRSFSVDIPVLAPGEKIRFDQNVGRVQIGSRTYYACIDFPCDPDSRNNCTSRSVTYF